MQTSTDTYKVKIIKKIGVKGPTVEVWLKEYEQEPSWERLVDDLMIDIVPENRRAERA